MYDSKFEIFFSLQSYLYQMLATEKQISFQLRLINVNY